MTLTDFLLARIAEDEAVAGELPADGYYTDDERVLEVPPDADGLAWPRRWSPVRVLAECEAKRRILADHSDHYSPDDPAVCDAHDGKYAVDECPTLRALAAVYADHPDYRDEWKV